MILRHLYPSLMRNRQKVKRQDVEGRGVGEKEERGEVGRGGEGFTFDFKGDVP